MVITDGIGIERMVNVEERACYYRNSWKVIFGFCFRLLFDILDGQKVLLVLFFLLRQLLQLTYMELQAQKPYKQDQLHLL